MWNFFYKVKISYCITVCDEFSELQILLETLIPFIKRNDEIIVLIDTTTPNKNVEKVISKYKHHINQVIERPLNGDFSAFKNSLIAVAKGNYIFQIDADEVPQALLLKKLKQMLCKNKKNDCFCVPRINLVQGISDEHLKNWNWKINDKNFINYPDYQMRIFKLNCDIKWTNKVHETLIGFTNLYYIPSENFDLCLLHDKTINKQIEQNTFYENL